MPADDSFRRRALAEAARYGSDPLVFVRELLQNARDAGASRVEISVRQEGGRDRVGFLDDGCGMTSEHARRYLFALYASSKDDDRDQAGKFGIGFWAVLRFSPSTVTIRSRAATGEAWQISLDGKLEQATVRETELDRGTEVILERPALEEDLAEVIFSAVHCYGRFLTRRDPPGEPLEVTVNGRSANAELTLPAPSAAFRGKGFRGVVGLGAEPKVELFAQGLFVRSADSLQDLQEAGELRDLETTEDVLAELPSLAPRVLIDSAELDLLLARGDARYDRHLRRVLRVAEKELGRLIERQLQTLSPQPWYRPLLGALRDRLESVWGWRLATATAVGLVLGATTLWWLPSEWLDAAREKWARPLPAFAGQQVPESLSQNESGKVKPSWSRPEQLRGGSDLRERPGSPRADTPDVGFRPLAASARGGETYHEYFDLSRSYSGPRPGALTSEGSRLIMNYEPSEATPFFNALVVDELDRTRWVSSVAAGDLPPYVDHPCRSDCVSVRLLASSKERTLRLPVPTGHRLEVGSVRLDGAEVPVLETANGEAVIRLRRRGPGLLEYRTGPAPGSSAGATSTLPAAGPSELLTAAESLRSLPIAQRVQAGLDYVARSVRYDRSRAVMESYERRMENGSSFVEAALDVGAGDCDVQNGVLVSLLRLAGVEARLVLGYVGDRGAVAPGLHAWVEYLGDADRWSVADASMLYDSELSGAVPRAARLPPDPGGRVQIPTGQASDLAPGEGISGSPTWIVLAVLLAMMTAASLAWRRRFRPATALAADEDLAALLGGALRHPAAFAGLPAMFHGRFVPLVGNGRAISLHQARRLGNQNRLFRSSLGSPLAIRAAARGVLVIDSATAEGRVLSLALGAIDLDHWSSLMDRAEDSELCRYVNQRLDQAGAPWQVLEAPDLPEPWVEIAQEDLRLGQRLILLDLSHLEFAPVRGLLASRPAAATFTLLDVLLHRLDLPERERARVLTLFAHSAVSEAAGLEARTA